MSFITLDFETFYSDQVGFKRQTNEEYLRDPQFEVVGVSVKVNDAPAIWFSGDKIATKQFLDQFNWQNSALLAHNTMFDGAILAWHFDIVPAMYFDTLCMARAIHGVDAGGSLAKLAERYELGEKGTEVINALGKKRLDFDADSLARYGAYCINDTELTYKLFNILAKQFPRSEFALIDMTLRMYTQPVLCVNDALLVQRLDDIREEKSKLLAGLQARLECDTEEAVRKKLCSNPQFAQVLTDFGVTPPTKISAKTGKEAYAFAKTDEEFIALQEHEDSFIQQLCAVRLGTKSTIEESRIERFIEIGSRNRTRLPIPLKYYGTHTGRWAGMDMVNFQNLPSRDKRKKTLKNAIIAPDDHYIINCDSSQIEARVLAWLAGQDDVTKQFARGEDVYSIFASKIYKRDITKADPTERFVGKTCLAAGTRVLTRRGWIDIVDVGLQDQLWDGVEWVNHCGVSFMGVKPIIKLSGVELTHDHEILTDHTKWESAEYVLTHDTAFQSALNLATLSLLGTTSRTISGLSPLVKICTTKEKSKISKPVFDILNSGSRNRFTVLTERGPIIVHNCVLGLGYGTGAAKLRHTLATQPPGADLEEAECKRMVDLYRRENDKIPALWRECDLALAHLASWPRDSKPYPLGQGEVVWVTETGIKLPNGLYIRYPELRSSYGKYIYNSRKGITNIWGGTVVENVVQALARIIVGEQMLEISKRYRVSLTVHDAAVIAVPKSEIEEALSFVTGVMSTAPSWCPDLPVACEAKYSETYGGC